MKEIFVMEESCYNFRSRLRLHVPRVWKRYLSEVVESGMPFLMSLKTHNVPPAVSATYIANVNFKMLV